MAISVMTLTACPFFLNASVGAINFAASHMNIIHMKRREILNYKNTSFDGLGIVIQGGVQAIDLALDGKGVVLLNAEENDIFGHQMILSTIPSEINWFTSVNPTTLALMEKEHALKLLKNYPELMNNLAQMNSDKIQELLVWQKIQAIHPVNSRVCAWLLNSSKSSQKINLPTHAEMALRLNTTRESVTRVIQKLANQKIISKDGVYWNIEKRSALIKAIKGDEK